ncbi:GerAB/ArcD/ProY family transporter [Paenibacillus macerans]|uniref:GerAB/ArcD/ProY family transporter n=1 Tax=Paenibacillus macerans TaxID=44252 RepID=A0A6N8EUJ3_PAEMA|nr:GerAB/ArcD/ProY family transporter [Paenibacillus macerans]MUG23254.1 GerAB/ArcD/ProY family transporter [Paenibacillus macerans]UMV46013.1 spore germination protein [Paenibacillus macerans]
MFTRSDDKITTSQAVVFLTDSILGAGILTLPRSATEEVQTPDAWLSVVLASVLALLVVFIMIKLSQQFPGNTVFEFSQKIAGVIPGSALSALLIVFFMMMAVFEIRMLAEVTIFYLLEDTPIWAIIIPFIWVAAYLISGGINCIARLFQIIFPVSILVLVLSLFLSLRLFDIDNMRPLLGEGLPPVIAGLKSTLLSFAGFEVVLILVGHLQHPEKAVKRLLPGMSIPIALYLITTVIVVGGMSTSAVLRSTWPTLDLLRSFEISGLFFERFEFPFLVIWIMQMFCNFTSNFFVVSLGVSNVFRIKFPAALFALMPVIFIAALLPKSINDLLGLGGANGIMSVIVFVLVTLPLSVIFLIRKKGLKQHA